jgi:hypothetical protein
MQRPAQIFELASAFSPPGHFKNLNWPLQYWHNAGPIWG